MNTIQIVTYFRLMANWPANVKLFFEAVYQAAYLDYIYDWLEEFTGERYERLNELTSDESIRRAGIEHTGFVRGLGVLAIALLIIGVL